MLSMVGEANPIAAGPPCIACCTRFRHIHTDEELESCARRIVVQVFKCRADVGLGWITDVQGESVESNWLLEVYRNPE